MAKYVKKPVMIEAVQLRWDTWEEACTFVQDNFGLASFQKTYIDKKGNPTKKSTDVIGLTLFTDEGVMLARQNDYIIKGAKGELYYCTSDIFAETYETLDSEMPMERQIREQWLDEIRKEMEDAERKAWYFLGVYNFHMFGYWASVWVHLNRLSGERRPNPFHPLVDHARAVRGQTRGDN